MSTIQNTSINVPGRAPFVVPSVMDANQAIAAFGTDLNLAGMEHTTREEGNTRYICFKHKTGTKG